MKFRLSNYTFLFVVSGIIVILDQWTKHLVRSNLSFSEIWAPWDWLIPYARIVHWQNTGAAFGMFQGMSMVFLVLAVIVSVAIIYYYPQIPKEEWLIRLAMGMMLGGAIGNLIDRLRFDGAVTDFISVGSFAVFNIADASISVGVPILILGMWLREKRLEKEKEHASEGTPTLPLETDVPQSSGEQHD